MQSRVAGDRTTNEPLVLPSRSCQCCYSKNVSPPPKVTKLLSASNNPALNFSRASIVLLRYCSVDRRLLCVQAARARRVLLAARVVLSVLGSEVFGGKRELDCRNENKPLTSCCFHSWSGEAVGKLLLGEL